jgi:hypothetical protein
MNKSYPYIIGRFIVLVATQVLLVDHIDMGGYIHPPIYILFILLLPFDVPKWLLLISAFFLGLSVDSFSNSSGLNAAASVFIAFARPFVIKTVGAPAEYEGHLNPGIPDMGVRWFIAYSLVLIVLHQLSISILESFNLAEFGLIMLKVVLSSMVSLILVLLIEYLFSRQQK